MNILTIIQRLQKDERNAAYTAQGLLPVFQIHTQARILLIGQAPGSKAQLSGIPFHDLSGDRLRHWMGVSEEIFYGEKMAIMPMDFYYPGKGKTGDLPPRPFIAEEYHPTLLGLMPHIEMTLLIGRYAIAYYLQGRMARNLTETVRQYQTYLPDYFPLVHPSPLNMRWLKHNSWFEADVVPQLQARIISLMR